MDLAHTFFMFGFLSPQTFLAGLATQTAPAPSFYRIYDSFYDTRFKSSDTSFLRVPALKSMLLLPYVHAMQTLPISQLRVQSHHRGRARATERSKYCSFFNSNSAAHPSYSQRR